jgi:hypothetical protein
MAVAVLRFATTQRSVSRRRSVLIAMAVAALRFGTTQRSDRYGGRSAALS